MEGKKKRVLPLLLALFAAVSGLWWHFRGPAEEATLLTSGHIETNEVDVSFRLSGHVERLLVDEGYPVKKGELLAELDEETIRARRDQAARHVEVLQAQEASLALSVRIREELSEARVRGAEAEVSAASARYESLKTGSRGEEIREAAAARDMARTEWENREREHQRMKSLHERTIISTSAYDTARTLAERSHAAFLAAEERYRLVKAGPRREAVEEGEARLSGSDAALRAVRAEQREVERLKLDLAVVRAQIQEARSGLEIAAEDLKHAKVYAPFDGFVTVRETEQGEFVQAGTPVVTVVRLDQVWVRTYVPETRLGKIFLGQKAQVLSDTFPDKRYPGVVTFISPEAEFTPKNVQTREERIKLVYRIKVTLDNPDQELKIGMPVEVLFP